MTDAPTPSFDLDGQQAVVTGAGRGIGRSSALGLAEAGADLVLISRNEAELEAVADAVRRLGRAAAVRVCDVTDGAQVSRAFVGLEYVDLLVNCAGANVPEPFVDVSAEHLDQLVDVNLKAPFRVSQAAVERMGGGETPGAIINITSQMGRVGAANRSVYCATKHGLEGLTRALAVELAPRGIRVNAVSAGWVEGSDGDHSYRADVSDRVRPHVPAGRNVHPDDVAAAVAWLCSDEVPMLVGQTIHLDGGFNAASWRPILGAE